MNCNFEITMVSIYSAKTFVAIDPVKRVVVRMTPDTSLCPVNMILIKSLSQNLNKVLSAKGTKVTSTCVV